MSDLYRVLGVSRTASTGEIKSAYRRLARKYHPDVNADPSAAQEFARITEAYQTLIDPQRRAYYERTGVTASSTTASKQRAASSVAAARAARRAYYQARADRIVNEWLEREREESRWRGQAVYTTVALFLSTFMVAMVKPSIFENVNLFWKIAFSTLFAIGVWHMGRSLKQQLDHYTYRPVMISLMRYRKPEERFSRGAALAFIGGGYLLSLCMGMLIGSLMEDLTRDVFGKATESVLFSVLFYPPIVVLIVDLVYKFNQRIEEW